MKIWKKVRRDSIVLKRYAKSQGLKKKDFVIKNNKSWFKSPRANMGTDLEIVFHALQPLWEEEMYDIFETAHVSQEGYVHIELEMWDEGAFLGWQGCEDLNPKTFNPIDDNLPNNRW